MVRRVMVVAMAFCLWSRVAVADADYGADAGYGLLAVTANVFYMPAKVVYALLGGMTGSLAYLLTVGDLDTAQSIWSPSLGGTYVITPAILRNDEPLLFSGPSHSRD
jgi:hypothetical protein